MGKIKLEGMTLFAYHGFFEEERSLGNKYEVDLTVESDFDQAAEKDLLEHTVDYGQLYQIVSQEMQVPTKLLERLAGKIADQILKEVSTVKWVEVRVSKMNPPLGGICRKATITLTKNRNI